MAHWDNLQFSLWKQAHMRGQMWKQQKQNLKNKLLQSLHYIVLYNNTMI